MTDQGTVRRPERDTSAVGLNPVARDTIGTAMRVLSRLAGSDLAGKYNLRGVIDKTVYGGTKTGFRAIGAAGRTFEKVAGDGKPQRLGDAAPTRDYFDLTPDDDQRLILETVREFAAEVVRPAAADADTAAAPPADLLTRAAELGITSINVPENLDGAAAGRSAVTNALVYEALSHGDLGLALPIIAPSGVAIALTNWGTDEQQKTYLPAYAGENVPASSVAVAEPRALFDPFALHTTAVRAPGGYVLDGVKSLVPVAGSSELFVVAAELDGRPALFIVEASASGVTTTSDPSMGLRGAAIGRLHLDRVSVPASALLGSDDPTERRQQYAEAIRSARLGWSALAVGTCQAVLDYVIPYVNEREAFGEPISNRQAVAFMVADIATELEGMRLVTWRGAARVDQGMSYAREAALARKLATDKGMRIGLDGVQLLGGHGFVKEHPVERWYRNLRAVGVAEGVALV